MSTGNLTRPRRWLLPALPVLVMVIVLLIPPTTVSAHPLGNFTINRYSRLELGAEQVHLIYVVDMAEIPAFQERARIDADHDRSINSVEHDQYLAGQVAFLQSNLYLVVDGVRLRLESQEQSLEFLPGQGGLQTLRLSARFVALLPPQRGAWQAEYRDENYTGRLGWQEVVVRAAHDTESRTGAATHRRLQPGPGQCADSYRRAAGSCRTAIRAHPRAWAPVPGIASSKCGGDCHSGCGDYPTGLGANRCASIKIDESPMPSTGRPCRRCLARLIRPWRSTVGRPQHPAASRPGGRSTSTRCESSGLLRQSRTEVFPATRTPCGTYRRRIIRSYIQVAELAPTFGANLAGVTSAEPLALAPFAKKEYICL